MKIIKSYLRLQKIGQENTIKRQISMIKENNSAKTKMYIKINNEFATEGTAISLRRNLHHPDPFLTFECLLCSVVSG
jgi:hypothetical protein